MRKIFQEREGKSLFTMLIKDPQLFDREYFLLGLQNGHKDAQKPSSLRSTATPVERLLHCAIFWDWRLSNSNQCKLQDKFSNDGQNNKDQSDIQGSSDFLFQVLLKLLTHWKNNLLLLLNSKANGIFPIVQVKLLRCMF